MVTKDLEHGPLCGLPDVPHLAGRRLGAALAVLRALVQRYPSIDGLDDLQEGHRTGFTRKPEAAGAPAGTLNNASINKGSQDLCEKIFGDPLLLANLPKAQRDTGLLRRKMQRRPQGILYASRYLQQGSAPTGQVTRGRSGTVGGQAGRKQAMG